MQSSKNAAASAKETASNIAASAKSGMEKTKAAIQEKVERMTAHDPMEKEMATEKKQERMQEAELNKQEAREQNAASKQATAATGHVGPTTTTGVRSATYSTTGQTGHSTGLHQMSAVPRHGTGQPNDHVIEGVATAHPVLKTDASEGRRATHDPRTGGAGAGYGTGKGTGGASFT